MVTIGGLDRRIRGRFEEQTDVVLILHRSQLLAGEVVEGPGCDRDEERRHDDSPTHRERAVEQPRVGTRASSNRRFTKAVNRPSFPRGWTNRELMTGESVIATMPDKTTATANVMANSRNNDPVSPPWNPMGHTRWRA